MSFKARYQPRGLYIASNISGDRIPVGEPLPPPTGDGKSRGAGDVAKGGSGQSGGGGLCGNVKQLGGTGFSR